MNSPTQATYYAEATERGPLDPRLTDYIYEAVTIDEHHTVYHLDHAIFVDPEDAPTLTHIIEAFEDDLPTTGTTWRITDGVGQFVTSITTEYATGFEPTANTREALDAAMNTDPAKLAKTIRHFATTNVFTSGTQLTADQWLGIFATGMRNATTVNA